MSPPVSLAASPLAPSSGSPSGPPPALSSASPRVSTSRTALLTLGRLPVALEIARALAADGWRVVVAEPLGWHLCRTSNAVARCHRVTAPRRDAERYLRELLCIVDAEDVSLVVPVSEEMMFVADLHARLPPRVRLACAPRALLLELHDKWCFAERAHALGLAVPATALASSEAGARIAARGAHVIKPRLSCAGVGVSLHERAAKLDASVRRDDLLVQERLDGEPCCAFALARHGAVRQLVVYRSLLESGSVSVTFERVGTPADVRRFVEAFVRGVGHDGMIGFDFIADGAGHYRAIECNPRATSGIHLLTGTALSNIWSSDASSEAPAEVLGHASVDTTAVETAVITPVGVPVGAPVDTPVGASDSSAATEGVRPVGTRRQEFWSALIEIEGALLRGRLDRSGWRRLFTTPDVNWRARDPKPFLLMTFSGLPLLWRAIRARRPITEVTLRDVGWYGDVRADSRVGPSRR